MCLLRTTKAGNKRSSRPNVWHSIRKADTPLTATERNLLIMTHRPNWRQLRATDYLHWRIVDAHTELPSAIHTYYGMTCFIFYLFVLFIAILIRWGLLFLLVVLTLKVPHWHRALCAVDVRLLQLNGPFSSKQCDFFPCVVPFGRTFWWVNCCVCSINASHVIAYARHYAVVICSFCHRLSQNASRDAKNMHVTHAPSSEPEPPTTMAQIEKKHITQNPNPLRHSLD